LKRFVQRGCTAMRQTSQAKPGPRPGVKHDSPTLMGPQAQMRLSVVTDELSSDLETALELCQSWGVDAIELRGIDTGRYPEVSDYWRRRAPELVRAGGFTVCALSPGLFKIPFPGEEPASEEGLRWLDATTLARFDAAKRLLDHHLSRLLPASIDAALELGTSRLLCFSFVRGPGLQPNEPLPEGIIAVLREAADRAQKAGVELDIETEDICWGDTAVRTASIVERVGHPSLGVNLDPANCYFAGEVSPLAGYLAARPHVRHIHFKDAIKTDQGYHFTPRGELDWLPFFRVLASDEYRGFISVETHARPKVASTKYLVDRLRQYLENVKAPGPAG